MTEIDTGGNPDSLQAWIIDWVARELKILPRDINVSESLLVYGIDSVSAIMLAGDLEDLLGKRLPPTLVWDHPTVENLVSRLQIFVESNTDRLDGQNVNPAGDSVTTAAATANGVDTDSISIHEARQLLGRIDELTDDQVDALLRRLSVDP